MALINFWGTWCPPCLEEFPHLMKLRESRVSRGDFQFVSVTSSSTGHDDAQELAREVTEFLRMSGVDLAVYSDPNGRTRIPLAQRQKFDGFSYPTTVVVDRKGVIRGIWVGYLAGEERDIERLVDKLLDEKST